MLHGGFRPPALAHVLDGEKDQIRVVALWREPAGVEQHGPLPDSGEGVLNLEVFNGMAVAQDLGQQRPQLRDVPLTIAQFVEESALRLFLRGVEVPVEGGVGRADPQALVEDHERLSQGRNDVLRVGKGVLQFIGTLVNVRFHLALHLLPFSEAVPSLQWLFR